MAFSDVILEIYGPERGGAFAFRSGDGRVAITTFRSRSRRRVKSRIEALQPATWKRQQTSGGSPAARRVAAAACACSSPGICWTMPTRVLPTIAGSVCSCFPHVDRSQRAGQRPGADRNLVV